jgi:hypothetical protein
MEIERWRAETFAWIVDWARRTSLGTLVALLALTVILLYEGPVKALTLLFDFGLFYVAVGLGVVILARLIGMWGRWFTGLLTLVFFVALGVGVADLVGGLALPEPLHLALLGALFAIALAIRPDKEPKPAKG